MIQCHEPPYSLYLLKDDADPVFPHLPPPSVLKDLPVIF